MSDGYPVMLYRGGVLSPEPANYRTVQSIEDELAAMADGFERFTRKPSSATAPGVTDPAVAQAAAFVSAAAGVAANDDEPEQEAPRRVRRTK